MDINRPWENITENIEISAKKSIGHYELKQHKLWFEEQCSKLLEDSYLHTRRRENLKSHNFLTC
jgi:hypothetical protein